MVFKPISSWALSFLHVTFSSDVIFVGVDMTVPIETSLRMQGQVSCCKGWFTFLTHVMWLVFVALKYALCCFLVVLPSRSIVFLVERIFAFVVVAMVLRLRFKRDVLFVRLGSFFLLNYVTT